VMSPLHQDLNPADGGKFIQLLIKLLERDDVMVAVFFGAIKRAELAVDIADVGVIDIAIDDVGNDFVARAVVGRPLGQSPALIGQSAQLLQRPFIKDERVVGCDPFSGQNFVGQRLGIDRNHLANSTPALLGSRKLLSAVAAVYERRTKTLPQNRRRS
jgi:hypothetical protein